MKLPRGVRADRLIRALQQLGYEIVRQKGSHVRMRKSEPVVHLITVPLHDPLKTGMLHGILSEVVAEGKVSLEVILKLL